MSNLQSHGLLLVVALIEVERVCLVVEAAEMLEFKPHQERLVFGQTVVVIDNVRVLIRRGENVAFICIPRFCWFSAAFWLAI